MPAIRSPTTLTFSNASVTPTGATAYDIVLLDTLNSNLTLQSVIVTSQPTYAGFPSNVVISGSGPPSNLVDARVQQLKLGDSVTVQVTAVVIAAAPADQIIPNVAALTYTSLSGANGMTPDATGSTTPAPAAPAPANATAATVWAADSTTMPSPPM